MRETMLSTPYDLFGPEFMDTVQGVVDDDGRPVDGMDFVCRTARAPHHEIVEQFSKLDATDHRAVVSFLDRYFEPRLNLSSRYVPAQRDLREHSLHMLTDVLVCKDANPAEQYPKTQYLPLKEDFVVPDVDRFPGIMFGWDDREVVDGLLYLARTLDFTSEKEMQLETRIVSLVESIIQNKADLIDMLGYVPNGTVVSLATRAQPPMFADTLDLYAQYRKWRSGGLEMVTDQHPLVKYLPQMLKELNWWGKGRSYLEQHPTTEAAEHVVRVRDKEGRPAGYMYRYYDRRNTPRDESHREDMELAHMALKYDPSADVGALFGHIRAAAESGWDFSFSRQNKRPEEPWTNVAGNRIPPDLNAMIARSMELAAQGCELANQIPGTDADRRQWAKFEARRLRGEKKTLDSLINQFNWNPATHLYHDYDFVEQKLVFAETLAGMFPLYSGSATPDREQQVVQRERDFRIAGGWGTSMHDLEGQWDGKRRMWPILLRFTQQALERSGHQDLAQRGRGRVVRAYSQIFAQTGKVPEKADGFLIAPVQAGEYTLHGDLAMSLGAISAMLCEVLIERDQLHKTVAELGGNSSQRTIQLQMLDAALTHYQ